MAGVKSPKTADGDRPAISRSVGERARVKRALRGEYYLTPDEGQWLARRIVELELELGSMRKSARPLRTAARKAG